MRQAAFAIVGLLAGCQLALDLRSYHEPTGCHDISPPLAGDTFLAATQPATAEGGFDGVIMTDGDPGLFRFLVDGMMGPDERIDAVTLTLSPLVFPNNEAKACSASRTACGYCATTYVNWELYAMTPAWNQLTATTELADTGVPWSGPSASGAADRSAPIATGPSSTNQPLVMTAEQLSNDKDLSPYVVGGHVAFQVTVVDGTLAVEALEHTVCYPSPLPSPSLTLSVCR